MLRGALRRIAILVAVVFGLTAAASLAIGALAGANLLRALADGFYATGAAVLVGSFALGMRGPTRADWGDEEESGGQASLPPVRLLPRRIRRTSPDERTEARRNSLALFALGILLIFIGSGFDPSRHAF